MGTHVQTYNFDVTAPDLDTMAKAIHYVGAEMLNISDIETVYDFGSNPDVAPMPGQLPAALFVPFGYDSTRIGPQVYTTADEFVCWLLAAQVDNVSRLHYFPFLVPQAQLLGRTVLKHFNDGGQASFDRQKQLCSDIVCSSIMINDMNFGHREYAGRGYALWSINFIMAEF